MGEYIPVFSDKFGLNVSISNDGNTVAVGGLNPFDSETSQNGFPGRLSIFQFQGLFWQRVGEMIIFNDAEVDNSVALETPLSLSGDGQTVIVGAPTYMSNGTFSGQVRVYDISEVVSIEETDENLNSNRELIKVYDLLGRETVPQINTFQIYKYSDGTTEKKFVLKD